MITSSLLERRRRLAGDEPEGLSMAPMTPSLGMAPSFWNGLCYTSFA